MRLYFYNSLTRKKELFKPIRKDWVGLYTCGPTVYNFVHIGNLRTYIFEDVLRRTLAYAGFHVRHVMNITDVEDKIIREASAAGKNIRSYTAPYEKAFYHDVKKLNILRAWKYPKATQHIHDMISLITILLQKKRAYTADDSVYFDISRFSRYGRLSQIKKRSLKAGARASADEYTKNEVQDFVLWKAAKPNEPSWRAPFGRGRPGWHIECSAMSMKYLGETFDIHTGGVDLLFPHHENEIAQSEGATGKPFARFFVEGEHLLINREKMSKSIGNIFTLRDIEEKNINPLALRYLVLTAHYRSKLNFTWESLTAAEQSLKKLYEFARHLATEQKNRAITTGTKSSAPWKKKFETVIMNDLDTPRALAIIWDIIHEYHKNPSVYNPKEILKMLYEFDTIFGLNLKKITPETIPQEIIRLAARREEYRKEKKWQEADRIRSEIEEQGWIIEDTPEGVKIKARM